MAAPPSLKRLAAEDFEESEDWFKEKFIPLLNGFFGDTVEALTNSLTVADNFAAEEREIRVVTGPTVAVDATPFPIIIQPQRVRRVSGVIVTNPIVKGVMPVGAVQPFWDLTSRGEVRIRYLTGLDANATYHLRLRFD